jgi:hypothetical protein
MQDNTEVTLMRDVIEQYYLYLRLLLATQVERAALDAFYLRIRLVEDKDAVVEAYYALRDQFDTQAERDAIGDLCQGICSYDEPYVDDDDIIDILPEWPYNKDGSIVQGYNEDGSIAEPLPDEFFLGDTPYVMQRPLEGEAITALFADWRKWDAESKESAEALSAACGEVYTENSKDSEAVANVVAAIREQSAMEVAEETEQQIEDDFYDPEHEDFYDPEYEAYVATMSRVDSATSYLLSALLKADYHRADDEAAIWHANVAEAATEVLQCIADYNAYDLSRGHKYVFLRTLHSSGIAQQFEQALNEAAERAITAK